MLNSGMDESRSLHAVKACGRAIHFECEDSPKSALLEWRIAMEYAQTKRARKFYQHRHETLVAERSGWGML